MNENTERVLMHLIKSITLDAIIAVIKADIKETKFKEGNECETMEEAISLAMDIAKVHTLEKVVKTVNEGLEIMGNFAKDIVAEELDNPIAELMHRLEGYAKVAEIN